MLAMSDAAGRRYCNLISRCHVTNSLVHFLIPMLTGALFFILTAPILLSFYVQRFCRKRDLQRAAVLSSLGPDNARDDARNKKKKFIGFFHPYW
jgi:hypothetical protein